MRRLILLSTLPAVALVGPAFANEAVATASGVASLPYGDWIVAATQLVFPAAAAAAVVVVRGAINKFVPFVGPFITTRLIETELQKWADYGINATAGALKGKTLDVNTGSEVIAQGVNRAVDRANVSLLARKLLEWAGGPEEVAAKLFRLLPLDEHASHEMLQNVIEDLRARLAPPAAPGATVTAPAKF